MELLFKRPHKETLKAMSDASLNDSTDEFSYEAEKKIAKLTNHKNVNILNSGNSAILTAMNIVDDICLLPDQGGWRGFKQSARILNKEIQFIETDQGLIDSLELKKYSNSVLFLTSFAGYTAEQDIKEIAKIAHENHILVVEDVSGSISDEEKKLSNGKYSDIIVGSTGSPKIINVGSGGFISYDDEDLLKNSNFLLKSQKADHIICAGISKELEFAKETLKKEIAASLTLKKSLNDDFNVINPDKRGINVIFKSENPKELSFKLKKEINAEGRSIITRCPSYDRVKEKAIAIEIKNLANESLNKENISEIEDTVLGVN